MSDNSQALDAGQQASDQDDQTPQTEASVEEQSETSGQQEVAVGENTSASEVDTDEIETEEEDQPDAEAEQPQHYAREKLRAKIENEAGDSQSILGTTADATQLLLLLISRVLRALSASTDPAFTSIKSELAPFTSIAKGFLDKVETGQVKMPALVKGLEAVVAEIEDRSTKVATVIEAHKQQSSNSTDEGSVSE